MRAIVVVALIVLAVSNATYAQTLPVPIDVGLRRLSAHAISGFVEDRGTVIKKETGAPTTYALAFSISGLSNCEITGGIVTCQAYYGNDGTQAALVFWQLVRELHKSFAEKEYIPVSATGKEGAKVTQATYRPSGMSSDVDLEMKESAKAFDVTLRVYWIPSL